MVLGRSDDKDTMIYTNTCDPSHQTKYDNSTYTSDGTLQNKLNKNYIYHQTNPFLFNVSSLI